MNLVEKWQIKYNFTIYTCMVNTCMYCKSATCPAKIHLVIETARFEASYGIITILHSSAINESSGSDCKSAWI